MAEAAQRKRRPVVRDRAVDERLVRRYRSGDVRARDAMIERYLPLAHALALRYRRSAEPVDDLFQVACVGLIKAVDRWEPERRFAFSTFAVPTMLGELRRYFRDLTWDVRPPRRIQELVRSVDDAREDLAASLGRDPSPADLAKTLERDYTEVVEAINAAECRRVRSLDMVVQADEPYLSTVGDLVGHADEGYARVEDRATLERLTPILDRRAREVLRLRFEEELHQAEIGERVGCSQMHVSRIIRTSLAKMAAHGDQPMAA
jgi:RNA polymerase sigma-B factor